MASPLMAATTPPPAATTTSKKVPHASAKMRRPSRRGSMKARACASPTCDPVTRCSFSAALAIGAPPSRLLKKGLGTKIGKTKTR
ncbi:MAG: hypothetical protein ACYC6M_08480 [Terriglobales bacterium]